ncbi:MAG: hypothetical protein ACO3GO_07910, partial [Terrimicrobiaceae bacterium]
IAFTDLENARRRQRDVLGAEWLAKWNRSAAKFPKDLPVESRADFEKSLRALPQFLPLPG